MASRNNQKISKQTKLNTKWVTNALRSIGSITKTTFVETSPNLIAVVDESSAILKSVRDITKGNITSNINSTVSNNKYVRALNTAYKNAISDIKSGNLNNEDRLMNSLSNDDEGYSVGTEDEGGESTLNINVPDQSEAFTSLAKQIQNNSEAQLKMTKASVDATIAVSTASMLQFEKVSSEINAHLSNIENSISALVQYNTNNMQKYIDASIAYYERIGSKIEDEYGGDNKKLSASDVFNSRTGGINLSKYKQYVQQQFKDSPIGMSLGFITEEQTLKMLIANPLGTVGTVVASHLVPNIIKNTLETVEEVYSSASISILDKIGRLSERTGDTLVDSLLRGIGDTFGLHANRKNKFDYESTINKDAVPFDGVTKHAITEVITRELSEQTSYLRIIASHYDAGAASKVPGNSRVFSYSTGRYTTSNEIDKNLADSITDAIKEAFSTGSFGKGIDRIYSKGIDNDVDSDNIDKILKEFFVKLEKSKTRIEPSEFLNAAVNSSNGELNSIIQSLGSGSDVDKKTIGLLVETLREMGGTTSAVDLHRARLSAVNARNNRIKEIQKDPYSANLFSSKIFNQFDKEGNPIPIDKVIQDYYKFNKLANHNQFEEDEASSIAQNNKNNRNKTADQKIKSSLVQALSSAFKFDFKGSFDNIKDAFNTGASELFDGFKTKFIEPMKNTFFGTKDNDGYNRNGLFSSVQNSLKDLSKSFISTLNGKEWTDSEGKVHKVEKPEDTVMGNLKILKDNFISGLNFVLTGGGKKEINNKKEHKSFFETVKSTLKSGIDGWSKALFGGSEEEIQKEKSRIIKIISERTPDGIIGGISGGLIGSLSTGSILGTLVGGPVGGALLGFATGFASKSSKFQEWFFGKDYTDKEGNKIHQRGLISDDVQNLLKENKVALGMGAGAGLITGIGSGGLLGALVGGPVASALIGAASAIALKSDTFKEFLYGDEKTGQKGILQTLGSVFTKFGDNTHDDNTEKVLGMGITGAATGAGMVALMQHFGIMGAALSPIGPIGGALLGLGTTILAQKDSFKEFLFGKKNDKGEKISEGVFGRFTNMLKAQVINPFANTVADIADDIKISFKYDVLDTIRYAAEPLTSFLFGDPDNPEDRGALGSIVLKVNDSLEAIRDKVFGFVGSVLKTAISPIVKVATSAARLASKAIIGAATLPFKLIHATTSIITSKFVKAVSSSVSKLTNAIGELTAPIREFGKELRGKISNGIKGLIGNIGNFFTGVAGLAQYGLNTVRGNNSILSQVLPENIPFSGDITSFSARWKARKEQRENDEAKAKQNSAIRKQRSKNEKFIYKWTNGQYVADTQEAREAAILAYNAKNTKNQIDSEEAIKAHFGVEALDQKKNEINTGVGYKDSLGTSVKDLPWEGKIYKSVQDIYDKMTELFDPDHKKKEDKNKDKDGTGTDTNNNSDDSTVSTDDRFTNFIRNITNNDGRRTSQDIANDIAAAGLFNYYGKKIGNFGRAVKNKVSSGASKIAKLLHLPGYASGTSNAAEISLVGENGPEIAVNLSGNTSIAPNGGGIPVFITGLSDLASELIGKKKSSPSVSSDDSVMDDGKMGVTADEMQNRKEDEEREDEQHKATLKMAENTEKNVKDTEEHNKEWSGIFGKKGLITAGLITAGALLIKWLTNNGDLVGTVKNLLGGIGSGISNIADQFMFNNDSKNRTNGQSFAETVDEQVNTVKDTASKLADGNVLGATGSFVYGSDGKWDHTSAAKEKLVGIAGGRVLEKGYKVGVGIADGIKAVSSAASKVMDKGGLISKALTHLDDALKTVLSAVNKTFGTKLQSTVFSKFITKIKPILSGAGIKVTSKLGTLFASNTAKTIVNALPLINIGFIGISALNGLTGAARLFKVNSDNVNMKMRTISAGFAALTATLPGAVFDVVNEIVYEVSGVDILHAAAVFLYNLLSDEEAEEELKQYQDAFEDEYAEYREGEIKKAYEKAKNDGLIDPSTSYEDYAAGVESGQYEAEYMSFKDYNDSENASFASKVAKGISNGVSGIVNGIGNALGSTNDEQGGRGSTVNGFTYFSQNDPRWANMKYNTPSGNEPNATIGNSGCGPTAMSMVASQFGKNVNPVSMANYAKRTGNRDETGTNWNFIDQSSNSLGLQNSKKTNPSADYISNQLKNGHPMILSGKSKGGYGVYTSSGHYVVAVGTDKNGNVLINDPRGKSYSGAYNLNKVASETGASWSFGGRGDETDSGLIQNGAYYFAQNDSRWKNNGLTGFSGSTVGSSGCVMSSAAMGVSSVLGTPIDPGTFNANYGNGNIGSTNWNALGVIANRYPTNGSQGNIAQVPSDVIISALQSGYPVMLFGQKTKDNIYYDGGSVGGAHCVLATGLDSNGNIIVNDPVSSAQSTKKSKSYSISQLNPFYWAQVITNKDGTGIKSNLSTQGLSSSYTPQGGTSTDSTYAETEGETASESKSTSFLGTITNFLSEFASRALNGVLTGEYDTDYSSVFANAGEDSGSKKATKINNTCYSCIGGRGTTPVSTTTSMRTNNNLTTTYNTTGSVRSTNVSDVISSITGGNDKKLDNTISSIIKLLSDIASNTLSTSDKLDLLSAIQEKIGVSKTSIGDLNINATKNTTTASPASSNKTIGSTRNGVLANKIAQAG